LTGWQFIFGGIPILLGMLIFEAGTEIGPISTNAWLAVAYSAIVPMIVCHLLWYTLIGMLPVTIAAISTLAIPIVGVYSSALLLGEHINTSEWLALCLVVLALSIVLIPPAVWRGQKS
jgi:drug/metabolite transporter (DMT)-like permease